MDPIDPPEVEPDLPAKPAGDAEPPRWPEPPRPPGVGVGPVPEPPTEAGGFFARHGKMLWWLHSLYALGLGSSVVLFADKGFAHARFLTVSLAVVWIVLLVFFRLYGSGSHRTIESRRAKVRFYVMTYVLKNLYQGMLFFLIPFYWRAAVFGAATQWFALALLVCAALSTLDIVFDQLLMRWKLAASIFYFFTLFCCLNLVIPALFPNTRSLVTLVAAAGISALAFWTMHIPMRFLGRPLGVSLLVGWTVGSLAGSYWGRRLVPPAAMHVASGGVGPRLLDDGRLAIVASSLHTSSSSRTSTPSPMCTSRGARATGWSTCGARETRSSSARPTSTPSRWAPLARSASAPSSRRRTCPKTGPVTGWSTSRPRMASWWGA